VIEEEMLTVGQPWASSPRLGLDESVAKGFTKAELRNSSKSPAVNQLHLGQPRRRQTLPPTLFERIKQKMHS
jgi:hypothetical protein